MSATSAREAPQPAATALDRSRARVWAADIGAGVILTGILGLGVVTGIIHVDRGDVFIYRHWGKAIVGGAVPYRDIAVEYPPGALPLFIAPALVAGLSYGMAFVGMMLVATTALLAIVRRLASELKRRSAGGSFPRLFVASMVVVLGSISASRYDVVPAALTLISLLLVITDRPRAGGLALGAAIAIKLYPVLMLPLIITYVARRAGHRAAAGAAALAAAVVAAAYTPFLLVAARGIRTSLSIQLNRSLEIESLGGSLFVAAHRAFGIPLSKARYHYDFPNESAHLIGILSLAIGLSIIVGLWIAHARAPLSEASLIRYSAATLAAYVAFGKVLSPQYLLWLIPLVPLVSGRRGRIATCLLGFACLLTAVVFPREWDPALLVNQAAGPLTIIVIRDLLLVGLCAVLSWPAASRARDGAHSNRLELAVPSD